MKIKLINIQNKPIESWIFSLLLVYGGGKFITWYFTTLYVNTGVKLSLESNASGIGQSLTFYILQSSLRHNKYVWDFRDVCF